MEDGPNSKTSDEKHKQDYKDLSLLIKLFPQHDANFLMEVMKSNGFSTITAIKYIMALPKEDLRTNNTSKIHHHQPKSAAPKSPPASREAAVKKSSNYDLGDQQNQHYPNPSYQRHYPPPPPPLHHQHLEANKTNFGGGINPFAASIGSRFAASYSTAHQRYMAAAAAAAAAAAMAQNGANNNGGHSPYPSPNNPTPASGLAALQGFLPHGWLRPELAHYLSSSRGLFGSGGSALTSSPSSKSSSNALGLLAKTSGGQHGGNGGPLSPPLFGSELLFGSKNNVVTADSDKIQEISQSATSSLTEEVDNNSSPTHSE